jgi:thiol reductant ABC exporter CydC subunit
VAVVAVRAFGIFRGFLRYGERLAGHDAALTLLARLRVRAFDRLIPLVPRVCGPSRGDVLQRFATDVDAGLDLLVRVLLPYAAVLLAGAAAVVLLADLLPVAGLLLLALLVAVAAGVPIVQSGVSRRAQHRIAPLRSALGESTVDLLHGLPDAVAYGAAPARLAQLQGTERRLTAAQAVASRGVGVTSGLVVLLGGATVWAALVAGTVAVHSGRLTGVALAVVVLTPLAVLDVAAVLPEAAGRYGVARGAMRRVDSLLAEPDPVPDPAPPDPLPPGPYHLRVEGAAAQWTGAPVFAGLDLDLPPGRRVAVVGPSGCGKTTLAYLLVRFLDPVAGRVTLNGVDLRRLAGDDVRRVVGLMDESVHLFDTTIEANLRVGRRDATVDDLRSALAAARLLDWVRSLPAGLDTPVGEHGAQLSGGQRRRLALARLLLADPPILVLDEPTEHLDDPTAQALTDDLLAATADRTVVLITHRPYGLSLVDEVVRL